MVTRWCRVWSDAEMSKVESPPTNKGETKTDSGDLSDFSSDDS